MFQSVGYNGPSHTTPRTRATSALRRRTQTSCAGVRRSLSCDRTRPVRSRGISGQRVRASAGEVPHVPGGTGRGDVPKLLGRSPRDAWAPPGQDPGRCPVHLLPRDGRVLLRPTVTTSCVGHAPRDSSKEQPGGRRPGRFLVPAHAVVVSHRLPRSMDPRSWTRPVSGPLVRGPTAVTSTAWLTPSRSGG